MKSIFSGLTSLPLIFLFFLLWNSRVVKWLFLFFSNEMQDSIHLVFSSRCDKITVMDVWFLLIVFWRKVLFYYSSIRSTVQGFYFTIILLKTWIFVQQMSTSSTFTTIVIVNDYLGTFPVWKQQKLLAFILWFLSAILMKKILIQTLFLSIEGL